MGAPVLTGTLAPGVAAVIVPPNDQPAGRFGRASLFIQNTGVTNAMNVAIGAIAVDGDILLPSGESLALRAEGGARVPGDAISAYSAGGTTWAAYTPY
jgi:hypothetical protein